MRGYTPLAVGVISPVAAYAEGGGGGFLIGGHGLFSPDSNFPKLGIVRASVSCRPLEFQTAVNAVIPSPSRAIGSAK